jgi:hypothetical protein
MIEGRFAPHLLAGERLIWTGKPEPGHLLTRADFLLVPMSLLVFCFALFWEAGVLGLFSSGRGAAPLLFPLWGLPFVLAGLYMLVGRFVYKAYAKGRTFYALTDQRALVLSTVWGTRLQSAFIQTLPGISIDGGNGPGAVGTVVFSDQPPSQFANSGIPGWMLNRSSRSEPLMFSDLRDPQAVYAMVGDLRKR